MAKIRGMLFLPLPLLLLMMILHTGVFVSTASAGKPVNVTYDQRALVIDGQRRMLISAGIHYPRATAEMWPSLLANAKEGGADVIQTYVFWNGHEPQQGHYNFAGRYDLVKYAQLVQEAGLYLHLRIGPYVCAEWNFGGFPYWLKEIPGIVFRTDNQPFKDAMQTFVTKIVNLMKDNGLMSWQGGPVILAQIENEYGNVEWEFGDAGKRYVEWAANMAIGLNTGVPWVMCQQGDAPGNVINTCNGYYCDQWTPNAKTKPIFWTEDWNGWFQNWGQAVPHRPVEDNAFAVARFFQRGGSFQNYYMYFGGTNFARTGGGPFMTTTYDYDAPLDEYGLIRQPKWGHMKDLHAAIKLCEPALIAVDGIGQYTWLGSNQEGHVYSGNGQCAAFLANIDSTASATVQFQGQSYVLPAWSVSILPDCKNVVFNTAQIGAQTTVTKMKRKSLKAKQDILLPSGAIVHGHVSDGNSGTGLNWQSLVEPVGTWGSGNIFSNSLLEQLNLTKDSTDYLWYSTSISVSQEAAEAQAEEDSQVNLVLGTMRDAVHIFINGQLAGSALGWNIQVTQPIVLKAGSNRIDLLCMTMGLQNYGAFLETWGAGIQGSVNITGLASGNQDLSKANWTYQVGLLGESLRLYDDSTPANVTWSAPSSVPNSSPLMWYKTTFITPAGTAPVALDLVSMGKGNAWVNGHHLGRFWPSMMAPQSGCSTCDYRGAYNSDKCRTNCGEPSQRWYHIPRAWLNPTMNSLVLLEEIGGDLSKVSVVTRSVETVCGHISELQPPPVQSWVSNLSKNVGTLLPSEVVLECPGGQNIDHITFASFGNPTGSCGYFHHGSCHAKGTLEIVKKACIGKHQCSVAVTSPTFGNNDPCPSMTKSLAVQARCSSKQVEVEVEPTYFNYKWQGSLDESAVSPGQRKPPSFSSEH